MIEPINEYPTAPMDVDLTRIFIGLMMCEEHPDQELNDAVRNNMMAQLITKRVEWAGGAPLSIPLTSLLSVLADGSPGKAVMLTHAVVKGKVTTVYEIGEIFPMGFPTEESFSAAWDDQKLESGLNGLDVLANWSEQQ